MNSLPLTGRRLLQSPPLLTLLLVALVWLVASLTLRGFGAYGHLRYLLELAAVIGIVAAGQTLVIIVGGIDLSVGAVMTVTAILLPVISPDWDPTGLLGVVMVLAIAAIIGAVNGIGAAWLRVPPIIMTLAMATFLQGLLVIVAGGSAVSVNNAAAISWVRLVPSVFRPASFCGWRSPLSCWFCCIRCRRAHAFWRWVPTLSRHGCPGSTSIAIWSHSMRYRLSLPVLPALCFSA